MKVALAAILISLVVAVIMSPAATNVSARDGAPAKGPLSISRRATRPQQNGSEKRKAAGEKYYVLGNRIAESDPKRAVEYYLTAIRKGYDTNNLRIELGIALRVLRRYEEAFEQFRTAIRRDNDDLRAHLGLAYAFFYSADHREALKEFEHVKRLDPDSYRLGLFSDYVAKCFDALGEYEAALSEYETALRCNCQDQPTKEIIIKRIAEIKENLPRGQ